MYKKLLHTPIAQASRIDTLGVCVDLQALLRHLSFAQEVKWHPNKMTLDAIELLFHFLQRSLHIDKMALLVAVFILQLRKVLFVVLESANYGFD